MNAFSTMVAVSILVPIHKEAIFVTVAMDIFLMLSPKTALVWIKFGIHLLYDKVYLDIDECNYANGGCEQLCTNTNGSFFCSCKTGFTLTRDVFCSGVVYNDYWAIINIFVDINECSQGSSNCLQGCHNTIGSYQCTCHTGYLLANDSHNCIGIIT